MKLTKKQRFLLRKNRIKKARHKKRKLNKLKSTIELYRNDLAKFVEVFTGVKLTPVQKILLNIEYKNKLMIVPRRHGYKHSVDMVNKIKKQLLEEK